MGRKQEGNRGRMDRELFPKEKLRKLIIPLVLDQMLVVMVGMADTVMISSVGEAAVSGVSLVDTLSTLVLTLFTGLSTGGAVLCAHYAGQKKQQEASLVLKHMLLIILGVSLCFMTVFLWGSGGLLRLVFGAVEDAVFQNASVYFFIITLSFPFLGFYSSCTAVYRGIGNARLPMLVSLLMNLLNVAGNAVMLYGFGCGVEGVAIPTLLSRVTAACIMLALVAGPRAQVSLGVFRSGRRAGGTSALEPGRREPPRFRLNGGIVRRILAVGVPGSLEMSIFQVGKILVLGLIARLGTTAITANAIGNTLNNIQALPEDAIGLALVTVVGQCMGANEKEQAYSYTKKLLKTAYMAMWAINLAVFAGAPLIAGFFGLTQETAVTTANVIRFNCLFAFTVWPLAFSLPNALKGAYDVKYPLCVSLFSMWVFRVGLSYVAITWFHADIYMLYMCFAVDWVFRAVMFAGRFRSRKWLK